MSAVRPAAAGLPGRQRIPPIAAPMLRVSGLELVKAICAAGGYMGTAFLAARESMAASRYQEMIVASTADDIILTRAFTGLPTSMLRPSIEAAGLDPARLDENPEIPDAAERYGPQATGPRRWENIWSAGHSVGGVRCVRPAAAIVEQVAREYLAAGPGGTPQVS
jgi:nitronate monooxygenase